MATDNENALYAEASGLTSSWRETSNISRERIVAVSFHVFMATCTLAVGVAWFELFDWYQRAPAGRCASLAIVRLFFGRHVRGVLLCGMAYQRGRRRDIQRHADRHPPLGQTGLCKPRVVHLTSIGWLFYEPSSGAFRQSNGYSAGKHMGHISVAVHTDIDCRYHCLCRRPHSEGP